MDSSLLNSWIFYPHFVINFRKHCYSNKHASNYFCSKATSCLNVHSSTGINQMWLLEGMVCHILCMSFIIQPLFAFEVGGDFFTVLRQVNFGTRNQMFSRSKRVHSIEIFENNLLVRLTDSRMRILGSFWCSGL